MESQGKLLLEDLKHFGDSLWRNEESGEKRLNFLVTLITAVAGGLVTLHTAKDLPPNIDRQQITIWAIAGLLLFGSMIFLRMLQRIKVRREYQATLEYIRCKLVKLEHGPEGYKVPYRDAERERPTPPEPKKSNWDKARFLSVRSTRCLLAYCRTSRATIPITSR